MAPVSHPEYPALIEQIAPLAERFTEAGFGFYLVGGIVRDLLLGEPLSGDVDVTTDALPDEITAILTPWADTVWDQGARFGTIGAARHGELYEITTHRAEVYLEDSRKPVVSFSTAIESDLSRRDFTVNAMAIEVSSETLVDPFGGRRDLTERVLRTPLDERISFSDDPLRMLRAARFTTRYRLRPVEGIEQAIVDLLDRIDIVSRERIREELEKLFAVRSVGPGLDLLVRTGLVEHLLPGALAVRNGGCDWIDRTPARFATRLAALLVDADDSAGTHSARTNSVETHLHEMRCSNETVREVVRLIRAVRSLQAIAKGAAPTRGDARRVLFDHGDHLDDAHSIVEALGRSTPQIDRLLEQVREVSVTEGAASLRSPLSGDEVMALADDLRGRSVGDALQLLLDHRLDHGPTSSDVARELVLEWWRQRRDTPGAAP